MCMYVSVPGCYFVERFCTKDMSPIPAGATVSSLDSVLALHEAVDVPFASLHVNRSLVLIEIRKLSEFLSSCCYTKVPILIKIEVEILFVLKIKSSSRFSLCHNMQHIECRLSCRLNG